MKYRLSIIVLSIALIAPLAHAADSPCGGFGDGYMKVGDPPNKRYYLYSAPQQCSKDKPCPTKRKAYLLAGNVVQTGEARNGFSCVRYEGRRDNTPTITTGWMENGVLVPLPAFNESLFAGQWGQMNFTYYDLQITKDSTGWKVKGSGMEPSGQIMRSDCDFESTHVQIKGQTLIAEGAEAELTDPETGAVRKIIPAYTITYDHDRLRVEYTGKDSYESDWVCGDHGTLAGLYHR